MSHEFVHGRWEDLQCIQSLRSVGANVPALVLWQPAGSGGLYLHEFTSNQLKELFFVAQFPHRAKNGLVVKPHVHFTTRSTATTGTVNWQMEYTLQSPNGTPYTMPTTVSGAYVFTENKQDCHLAESLDSAEIVLPTTGSSHILVGRLFRQGGTAPDNFNASVFLLGFDFHYQADKAGTVLEFGP